LFLNELESCVIHSNNGKNEKLRECVLALVAGRCIPAPALKAGEEMIELVVNGQKYDKDNINANVVINATKTLAALASAEEVN
jgi:selenophosphate synthase